ncbi:uncharacterized protein LOC134247685 isoform X2 [Saccostrea cucullata]|uniref:uncharacterized protein LOC134247685 isoform X2 n=1 Tax=Saccostrea cuccullata TaxID=36930 RepID=UPI002ED3C964
MDSVALKTMENQIKDDEDLVLEKRHLRRQNKTDQLNDTLKIACDVHSPDCLSEKLFRGQPSSDDSALNKLENFSDKQKADLSHHKVSEIGSLSLEEENGFSQDPEGTSSQPSQDCRETDIIHADSIFDDNTSLPIQLFKSGFENSSLTEKSKLQKFETETITKEFTATFMLLKIPIQSIRHIQLQIHYNHQYIQQKKLKITQNNSANYRFWKKIPAQLNP